MPYGSSRGSRGSRALNPDRGSDHGAAQRAAAEAAARAAVAAAGDSAPAWQALALVLIEAGKLDQARDCLGRAVGLDPDLLAARNNLAVVLQRLGEREAAFAAYREVLAIDPDHAVTHNNLAGLLGELGRFDDSLDHARRAIELDPRQLGSYIYAAIAEGRLDHREAALAWLDRAQGLAPRSGAVLLVRADLLRLFDRAAEGLDACREAAALEPGNGKAHETMGLFCHALGRDEAALEAFDRAIRLLPQPAKALAHKAVVLLEQGRSDEGRSALDRALDLDRGLALGWFIRAETKIFAAADPDIAAMEHLLQPDPPSDDERILLHYALGKAYLDAKDAPRAFAHLHQGSRLKRATLLYDGAAAQRQMGAIAEAFPKARFRRLDGVGQPSEAPVFVIGMPRSGTTLIEQILASHPEVAGLGEQPHIERLVAELGATYPAAVAALAPGEIAALGRRYLALAAPMPPGVRRFTDKAADNFLHAGLIHLALPGARIIHCRRDPVDTCLSCYTKLFDRGQEFSYDLAELGLYYRRYAALMAHWRAVLPPERFIEVEYEKLVEDLEGTARRLIAFLGLEWEDSCLRFHETARPVRTASRSQVRRPLYRSSLGRWNACRDELGPLLAALGQA